MPTRKQGVWQQMCSHWLWPRQWLQRPGGAAHLTCLLPLFKTATPWKWLHFTLYVKGDVVNHYHTIDDHHWCYTARPLTSATYCVPYAASLFLCRTTAPPSTTQTRMTLTLTEWETPVTTAPASTTPVRWTAMEMVSETRVMKMVAKVSSYCIVIYINYLTICNCYWSRIDYN